MRSFPRWFALLAVAVAVPLFADSYSITPGHGPVAGGTEVTIKGDFGPVPYAVYFGTAQAAATRVDEHTLRATTPAHLPGRVLVTIFEYDVRLETGLQFTFTGRADEAFEPVLLPVFTGPISGAYGSEFRTDFRVRLVKETRAELYGLRYPCRVTCIQGGDEPYLLDTGYPEVGPDDVDALGMPGLFLYLPKAQADRVTMNLRAYDTSRSAENFGTEIPLPRGSDFAKGYDSITLLGVPSDARFRNTLRIYGLGDTAATLRVTIEGEPGTAIEHVVQLPGQSHLHWPGYVELSNFPTGVGTLRVTISVIAPPISATIPPPDRWAFISVTNNDTQHITTITPQP